MQNLTHYKQQVAIKYKDTVGGNTMRLCSRNLDAVQNEYALNAIRFISILLQFLAAEFRVSKGLGKLCGDCLLVSGLLS